MLRAVIEATCNAVFWGVVLTALISCLLPLERRTNAGTRFAIWCLTLAAVVLLPFLILGARLRQPHLPPQGQFSAAVSRPAVSSPARTARSVSPAPSPAYEPIPAIAWSEPRATAQPIPEQLLRIFPALWMCGALLMLARLAGSLWHVRRLRRSATPLPSAGIRIYSSPGISSPMAVGLISPAILLPTNLVPRLSDAEREHIILHEAAHIRRHDQWSNLAQRLAEALFFFQPAVWWIGRRLRFEREVACDDWAVAVTGRAQPYAASLAHLVELMAFRRGPVLATSAAANRGQISRRIEMLLDQGRNRSPRPAFAAIFAAACVILAVAAGCAQAPRVFAWSGSQGENVHQTDVCRSNFWGSFSLKSRGSIEFTENDQDVRSISPDGALTLEERQGLTWRKLSFTARGSAVERAFSINGISHPFEPDGRQWMVEILPRTIRETGIGAPARVTRMLRQGGATAVLAEISRIESNRSKRIYCQELIAQDRDPETVHRVLRQATHEIESDGDRRRLLTDLLNRGDGRGALLPELLQSAARLHSDGERAQFLTDVARSYPDAEAARSVFFKTLNTIGSDGERRRVLAAVLRRPLAQEDLVRVFDAAAKLNSDGEKTWVLVQGSGEISGSSTVRRAWFHGVDTINSDGEHRRALQAVLRGAGRDRETLITIIHSAARIASDGEKANVLSLVARDCPDDDAVISALVDAAQTLHSDGEYRRVITPLVRKGRAIHIVKKI